eukprot:1564619-Amphidinium_carterae.1
MPEAEKGNPIVMCDYAFLQDSPGSELFTILNVLDVNTGMIVSISCENKGATAHVVNTVCAALQNWGRKAIIMRSDGEPAIKALTKAIQTKREHTTVLEHSPRYSSASMGAIENVNKEVSGLVRVYRLMLKDKAKVEINVSSMVLPWMVRHAGWVISHYHIRADGCTAHRRLKGRDYKGQIACFGELVWYKIPETHRLGKLEERWKSAVWLGKSDKSDEHILGLATETVLARSVRRKIEQKRWNRKALSKVIGVPWQMKGPDALPQLKR